MFIHRTSTHYHTLYTIHYTTTQRNVLIHRTSKHYHTLYTIHHTLHYHTKKCVDTQDFDTLPHTIHYTPYTTLPHKES